MRCLRRPKPSSRRWPEAVTDIPTIAPQVTGVFCPDNWHFPGVAVKGDDAQVIATLLEAFCGSIESDNAFRREAAKYAKLFRSCWQVPQAND